MNPTDIHPGRFYGEKKEGPSIRRYVVKVVAGFVVYDQYVFGIRLQHQTTLDAFSAWARSERPPKSIDESKRELQWAKR